MSNKIFSISLKKEQYDKLKEIADEEERSLAYLIRKAIESYLKGKNYERNESV